MCKIFLKSIIASLPFYLFSDSNYSLSRYEQVTIGRQTERERENAFVYTETCTHFLFSLSCKIISLYLSMCERLHDLNVIITYIIILLNVLFTTRIKDNIYPSDNSSCPNYNACNLLFKVSNLLSEQKRKFENCIENFINIA